MPPLPNLPSVSSGNLALDLSGAASSLAQGLQAEKAKRREDAMAEAMLQLRQQQAMQPNRGTHVIVRRPEGLMHGLQDTTSGAIAVNETDPNRFAPESQWFGYTQDAQGNPTYSEKSRYNPGTTMNPIPMAPGNTARTEPSRPMATETPTGPGLVNVNPRTNIAVPITIDGQQMSPRAAQFEVEKAQFAANMSRAANGMEQISASNPNAVDEAVSRLNIAGVLNALPVIGAPAGEVARAAMAAGLSPAAAQWLAQFNTFLAFAVPELAGKQMTIQEMRQQTAMFAPLLGEAEEARQIKRDNVQFRVQSAIRASGSGWKRINSGGVGQQIPGEYGGGATAPKPDKYGIIR